MGKKVPILPTDRILSMTSAAHLAMVATKPSCMVGWRDRGLLSGQTPCPPIAGMVVQNVRKLDGKHNGGPWRKPDRKPWRRWLARQPGSPRLERNTRSSRNAGTWHGTASASNDLEANVGAKQKEKIKA
jgi:hypothetical protein